MSRSCGISVGFAEALDRPGRPDMEYSDTATPEFLARFELRKVALGVCGPTTEPHSRRRRTRRRQRQDLADTLRRRRPLPRHHQQIRRDARSGHLLFFFSNYYDPYE